MVLYVIQLNPDRHVVGDDYLYWRNDQGWIELSSADVYTEDEKNKYNLPIDGEWVQLPASLLSPQ
jgi:hypothetical protein